MRSYLMKALLVGFLVSIPGIAFSAESHHQLNYNDIIKMILLGDENWETYYDNLQPDQKKVINSFLKNLKSSEPGIVIKKSEEKEIMEVLKELENSKLLKGEYYILSLYKKEDNPFKKYFMLELPDNLKYKHIKIAETSFCYLHGSICNDVPSDKIILPKFFPYLTVSVEKVKREDVKEIGLTSLPVKNILPKTYKESEIKDKIKKDDSGIEISEDLIRMTKEDPNLEIKIVFTLGPKFGLFDKARKMISKMEESFPMTKGVFPKLGFEKQVTVVIKNGEIHVNNLNPRLFKIKGNKISFEEFFKLKGDLNIKVTSQKPYQILKQEDYYLIQLNRFTPFIVIKGTSPIKGIVVEGVHVPFCYLHKDNTCDTNRRDIVGYVFRNEFKKRSLKVFIEPLESSKPTITNLQHDLSYKFEDISTKDKVYLGKEYQEIRIKLLNPKIKVGPNKEAGDFILLKIKDLLEIKGIISNIYGKKYLEIKVNGVTIDTLILHDGRKEEFRLPQLVVEVYPSNKVRIYSENERLDLTTHKRISEVIKIRELLPKEISKGDLDIVFDYKIEGGYIDKTKNYYNILKIKQIKTMKPLSDEEKDKLKKALMLHMVK